MTDVWMLWGVGIAFNVRNVRIAHIASIASGVLIARIAWLARDAMAV